MSAGRAGPSRLIWTGLTVGLLLGLLAWVSTALAAPAIPPPPGQRVTDQVGVLSEPVEATLERRLAAYEAATGHQIIVWIDDSTGQLPLDSFAVEAFESWKLGRAGLDDGVAVFIMSEDRKLRIEVGYGLEPVLTDLAAAEIVRETMIPAIERGEWDEAVIEGVEAIVATIEGQPEALPADPGPATGRAGPGGQQAAPEPPWVRVVKIVAAVLGGLALIALFIVKPELALLLLFFFLRGGRGGGAGGGFQGGGGRSGGGGAGGGW